MDYLSFVLCLILTWVAIHFLLSLPKKDNKPNPRRLPPGPPAPPVFGNLFSLGTKPHISLTELASKYGSLMMLQLGQVPTVIISSAAVAKEAVQNNDVSFSSRHIVDAVRAHNHHEDSVAWLPAASHWRNLRKICNSHVFSASRMDTSQSLRRQKINDLLSHVEKSSEDGVAVDIGQAAFTTSLNLLSNTFFSVDLGDPNSGFARELRETIRSLLEEVGKPNFADYFPVLKFAMCLALAWITIHILSKAKKGREIQKKFPPGPPPLPILANLFSLGIKPHISLTELAKRYGPLMTLQLGCVPTVVISSSSVAKEALQKNDISFSNRMVVDGVRALGHHENSVVWLPVASEWRNLRTICKSHVFSTSRLDASQSLRRSKVKDLLAYVEKSSEASVAVDIGEAAPQL